MSDKVLYDNEWIQLCLKDDWYVYTHQKKSHGEGIAVLVFDSKTNNVLGRYEHTPCHGEGLRLTAITGMCDKKGLSPDEITIEELKEEAGIIADKEELIYLGWIYPSKSSDTKLHLYAIDGGDKELGKIEGDGTRGEEGAYVKWIPISVAMTCNDSTVFSSITKLKLKGIDLLSADPFTGLI